MYSLLVSLPTTIPLLFTFASFCVWLFDTITDMAVIENLWNFK
jgi:4-hydroxybenzoate polyprenyltransferase